MYSRPTNRSENGARFDSARQRNDGRWVVLLGEYERLDQGRGCGTRTVTQIGRGLVKDLERIASELNRPLPICGPHPGVPPALIDDFAPEI